MTELRKESWYVDDAPFGEGRDLVRRLHYARGGSNTFVFFHGLFVRGLADIWGVAWWLPPTGPAAKSVAGEDWRRVLALTRMVLLPEVPRNGASFLLGHAVRRIKADGRFTHLVTYADESQGHTGHVYRACGWDYVGRTGPYPRWVEPATGRQVAQKATFNRTKAQMEALGFVRDGSWHKHKFVKVLA